MAQLAQSYDVLVTLGAEVIAVPTDAAPDALKRLGAEPRVLFPVVTDGAAEIVAAYRLFARSPHAELLIDRQGYIRAITRESREAAEMSALLADRKSTRLNSSHLVISYAVFCLKKKKVYS